ncbi:hypothetical protein AB0C29_00195 [Actinoplanes sp. NPDC048791]|uniref:hypothetical protein n=1 Tax=Actinoplanes sp. NPDC048791 TaxID=3154623 RepID=UPI0033F48F9D
MTIAVVIIVVLTTFFTAGGISLITAGELPGLPLAVGGAVIQIGAIVLLIATRHVRRTLTGQTIARSSLMTARQTSGWVRRIALATIVVLIVYGLIRLTLGDPWSLLTAGIIGVGLFLVGNASKNIGLAQSEALNGQGT